MNEFQNNNQEEREENATMIQQDEGGTIQNQETSQEEKKSFGQLIGIVIIIAVIIIGGLYFYGKSLYQNKTQMPVDNNITAEEILSQPDEITTALEQQSTSDELVDIETDLNITDFDGLDAELGNIDEELGL